MTPRLSRSALVAACEALAEKNTELQATAEQLGEELQKSVDDYLALGETRRLEAEGWRSQVNSQADELIKLEAEITRLKSEIATKQKRLIIRRKCWKPGVRLAVDTDGILDRESPDGMREFLIPYDRTAQDWEEVVCPTCQPKGGDDASD